MNCILMPSLKHIVLVKVTVTLWNQDDVRILLESLKKSPNISITYNKATIQVLSKVSHLPLPEPLKNYILAFVTPIGLQILNYLRYHYKIYCRMDLPIPNKFCWTPQGIINRKKMAKILIKNEKISIKCRYILACIYCLVDDILNLWNEVTEWDRNVFYKDNPIYVYQDFLVILWTYDIKGEITKVGNMIHWESNDNQCLNQYAFEYAATRCNKAATEYFWQKLSSRQIEESLVRTTISIINDRIRDFSDVLDFLFFQMNEEQQRKICETKAFQILKHFLGWPRQCYFMKVISRMWDLLDRHLYIKLMNIIIINVMDKDYDDYDYQTLFQEVWKQSPYALKNAAINDWGNRYLFSKLFSNRKNIKLILPDATPTERRNIFCNEGHKICKKLIYDDEWDLVKFFIEECMPLKDEIIKFKEQFEGCLENNLEFQGMKMEKFHHLLDDIISLIIEPKDFVEEIKNKIT